MFLITITCLSHTLEAESVQLFAHLLQTHTSDHTHQSRGNWKRFSVLFSFSTKVCRGRRSTCKSSPLSQPAPSFPGTAAAPVTLASTLTSQTSKTLTLQSLPNHHPTPTSAFYLCVSYVQPHCVPPSLHSVPSQKGFFLLLAWDEGGMWECFMSYLYVSYDMNTLAIWAQVIGTYLASS